MLEIILAIAFFVLLAGGGALLALGAFVNNLQAEQIVRGLGLAIEGVEGTRAVRSGAWNLFNDGTTGLTDGSGFWQFFGSSNVFDIFTRTIAVAVQKRDRGGSVSISGNSDVETKKITTTVNWNVVLGRPNSIIFTTFLTHWRARSFFEDLKADFDDGTFTNTQSSSAVDGEVSLTGSGFACQALQGSLNLTGTADGLEVFVSGTTAYLVTANNGSGAEFYVIDVSDVTSPTITGSLELGASGNGVVVSGNHAFVASSSNSQELQVIDISTPSAPTLAASLNLSGNSDALSLAISGTTLYLGRASGTGNDFIVISIAVPTAPAILGGINISGGINGLAVSGTNVFGATSVNNAELQVYDVSVPATPTVAGSFNATGNDDANDVAISGTTLVLVTDNRTGSAELYTINIATPSTPAQLGSLEIGGSVLTAAISDSTVAIGTSISGEDLKTVSITDTANPSLQSTTSTGDTVFGIFAASGNFYIASAFDTGEFQISAPITTFDWACITRVGIFDAPGFSDGLSVNVSGTTAYLSTDANPQGPEFYVIGVSDLTSPIQLGTLELDNAAGNKVFFLDNIVYVASSHNSQELQVIDVSTPATPVQIGSLDLSGNGNALGIWVVGSRAYLTRENDPSGDELFIIDISTPSAPALLGSIDLGADAYEVEVSGNFAFVTTGDNAEELKVVNIFDPINLTQVDSFNAAGNSDARDLIMGENKIYMVTDFDPAQGISQFIILDVSNPPVTSQLGVGDVGKGPRVNAVEVDEVTATGFAGTSEPNKELKIVEFSDPTNPTVVTTITIVGGEITDMYFTNNTLYLTSYNNSGELQIFDILSSMTGSFDANGTYQSSVFDSGSTTTAWETIHWSEIIPPCTGCDIKVEFRAAASPASLATAEYTGPDGIDGDSNDFFTDPLGEVIHSSLNNNQYGQYRATFTADGTTTTRLDDIRVTYTP